MENKDENAYISDSFFFCDYFCMCVSPSATIMGFDVDGGEKKKKVNPNVFVDICAFESKCDCHIIQCRDNFYMQESKCDLGEAQRQILMRKYSVLTN